MLTSVSEIMEIIGRIGAPDYLSRFPTLRICEQDTIRHAFRGISNIYRDPWFIGFKSKETLRKNYLDPAIRSGQNVLEYPDKPASKNQRYKKV